MSGCVKLSPALMPCRYRDRPDGSVELLPTSQESQRAATSLMLELASKYHVYFGTIRDIWMKKVPVLPSPPSLARSLARSLAPSSP